MGWGRQRGESPGLAAAGHGHLTTQQRQVGQMGQPRTAATSSSSWTADGTEALSLLRRPGRDATSRARSSGAFAFASPHSARGAAVVTRGVGSGFGKWMQASYKEAFTEPKLFQTPRKEKGGRGGGGDGGGEGKDGNDSGNKKGAGQQQGGSSSSSSRGDGGGGGGGKDGGKRGREKQGGDGGVKSYDHVYIDVNNVLHVAAHHTKNEEAFFKKLFALLDLNLRKTRPQYTVTLALDGGVGQTLLQFLVILPSTHQLMSASMGHVTNLTPPGVGNPLRTFGRRHRLLTVGMVHVTNP